MQKCDHCGWNISDDTPLCPYCGSPVESEDEERRRRFMLRWHLNALLLGMQQPTRGFLLSPAPPVSRGRFAGTLLVTLASVLTLAVLIAGLYAFQQRNTGYASLLPTLTPGGPVLPGGPLAIHGSNFSPGGSVTITIDGNPATIAPAASSRQSSHRVYAAASLSLPAYAAGQRSAAAIPVKSDGTFDAMIMIDAKWSIGSVHQLIATEESNGLTASLALVVPQPGALLECSKSTNSTTLVLGPVDEGQKQTVSATYKLCTIGSGTLNWTARWNQQQASWLQLDSSGQLLAPLSKQLTVIASSGGLKAGIYSTTVTFSGQGSNLKLFLTVTLIVRAHTAICVNTNPQSLAFTAAQGQSDPAPQTVTITNCGHHGYWTASVHTDDGAGWLHVSPTGGNLKSKATQAVTMTASSAKLTAGTYTGLVTFKIGASVAAEVNISLNVQPSQSCITTNPQSLTFTAVQSQSPPGPQATTIVNCGSAGSWSASISTTDGANWLNVNPSQGHLDGNTSQGVAISVSSATLQDGMYTGQVTLTLGSNKQIVNITLTVQQQQTKPCLAVSPQALAFTSTQGLGNPAPQTLTLTNCGPTDSWSAAVSTTDGAPWLTVSDATGTLNRGASQAVSVAVSSGTLDARTYTGQVAFTTSAGAQAFVDVTWTMRLPPSCIQANPQALNFVATQTKGDPPAQTVTLTNCGPAGSWSASVSKGTNWLSVTPPQSSLNANATQDVSVSVSTDGLGLGSSTDEIIFAITSSEGTGTATVQVTLTVKPPPPACITVNQTSLSFTAAQGNASPQPQQVVLTNCGDTGSWTASPSDSWLTIAGNASGSLDAGATDTTSIGVDITNLPPEQYTGTVTFTIKTSTGQFSAQLGVTLTVTPPVPCISVDPTTLSFPPLSSSAIGQSQEVASVSHTIPLRTQPVTLTNCGDTGTVQATASTESGGAWLAIYNQPAQLKAGEQAIADVGINGANLPPPGTYHGTVTFTITVASGEKSWATVRVTLTVFPPPPAMQLSTATLRFDAGCSNPPSQSITVSNVGGGTLTWTVGTPSASWLTVSGDTSATPDNPGELTFTVNLAGLGNSTYTATVDITPSNGPAQRVTVTLNVQCIIVP